ncbi:MAG: hypothetical protein ACE5EF_00750 [Dehalococcoidia bacterium]
MVRRTRPAAGCAPAQWQTPPAVFVAIPGLACIPDMIEQAILYSQGL